MNPKPSNPKSKNGSNGCPVYRTKPLKRAVSYSKRRVNKIDVSLDDFITTDNLLPGKTGVGPAVNLPPQNGTMPGYEEGNILVSNIRPYLKKIWLANRSGGCSADVLVFGVKESNYPEFVYYSMFQDVFFDHMMRGSKGTKMPRGDKTQVMDFKIPDIGIENQKKIAAVLSALDAKIELNKRINAELEAMAKTLYDYWFVQFDFPISRKQAQAMEKPELEGKPYKSSGGKMVYNETLKREIPEGWSVQKIGSLFSSNRGVSYSSSNTGDAGIPMINLASYNVDGTYNPNGLKYYSGVVADNKKIKPYSLVMCNTQQTAIDFSKDIIGKAFLVPDVFDGNIVSSHHVTHLQIYDEPLKFYLHRLFNTGHFHKYITGFCSGTNILGLIFRGVEQYAAEIPPEGLIKKFASLMKPVQERKSIFIKETHQLASLRDWLLPMLMNGQVSVEF